MPLSTEGPYVPLRRTANPLSVSGNAMRFLLLSQWSSSVVLVAARVKGILVSHLTQLLAFPGKTMPIPSLSASCILRRGMLFLLLPLCFFLSQLPPTPGSPTGLHPGSVRVAQ